MASAEDTRTDVAEALAAFEKRTRAMSYDVPDERPTGGDGSPSVDPGPESG